MTFLSYIQRTLMLSIALIMVAATSYAQLKGGVEGEGRMENVSIYAEASIILIKPLETFGHRITITNTGENSIKFNLKLRSNPYFRQLNTNDVPFFINNGDSIKVPMKLLNVNARVNGIYTLYFDMISVYDSTDKNIFEFQVEVYNGTDRQIIVNPLQENILIKNNIRQFEVPVHFKNLLPENKKIYLEMQNPASNPIILGNSFHQGIILPPADTTLNLQFLVRDPNIQLWRLNQPVTVMVKDQSGQIISMFSCTPRWLFNKGAFYYGGIEAPPANSLQFEANHNFMGDGAYSQDFRLTKTIGMDKTGIGFNLNYMHFQPYGFKNLSNTYLQVKGESTEIIAGNVSEFHELSLFGRGIKATQFFGEDNRTKMQVWAVDQEVNLLRPFDTENSTRTISAQYSTISEENDFELNVNGNYFQRKQNNSTGTLNFGSFRYDISKDEKITGLVGASLERFNYERGDSVLLGYSGRVEYSKMLNKWSYGGTFAYGSRNYSGFMQGSLITVGRIGYRINDNTSISYHFNKNKTDHPTYTPQAIQGRFLIDYMKNEINIQHRVKNTVFSVNPYLLRQGQLFSYDQTPVDPQMSNAARINAGMNVQKKNWYFSVEADGGQFTAKTPTGKVSLGTYQLTGNIAFKGLSLGATVQNGPNFITEFTSLKDPSIKYYSKMLSMGYGVTILKKLEFEISASYINNASVNGNIYNANSQLNWNIGGGFKAHAMVYMFKIGDLAIRQQTRVGVVKTFNWENAENKKYKLTIAIFEDLNNNGIREPEEKAAPETMIRFNDMILIADKNGMVHITNVKRDSYRLSVVYGSSKQQNYIEKLISIEGNTKLNLGVPPQFKIEGVVKPLMQQYDNSSIDMDGVKVILIDKNNKEFVTYSEKSGHFVLQLPPGTYRAFLPEMRNKAANVRDVIFTVDPQKGYADKKLELFWSDNSRKIEVKKLN